MKTTTTLGFTLCLAAAWGTHGPADGKVTCDANGNYRAQAGLPSIRPIMECAACCTCRELFDNHTIARIIVGSDGYYHFDIQYKGTATSGPQAQWTCILFTDFTGLPGNYLTTLNTYPSPSVTATGGGRFTDMLGVGDQECIWAGLAGSLSATDGTQAYAFAQYDWSYTLASAQSAPMGTIASYAFCSAIAGWPWTPYLNHVVVPGIPSTKGLRYNVTFPAPGSVAGVKSNRWWCYMQGAGTSAGSKRSSAEKFSFAGLAYLTSDTYDFGVGNESALWFNCMGLDQILQLFER